MDDLIKALTVPFVAGLVVQRVVEILDTYTTAKIANSNLKKFVIGVVSLILGWLLARYGHIQIFSALKWQMDASLDVFASGIFISGGSASLSAISVACVVVVAPIWIVAHYLTRWRRSRKLSAADERSWRPT